ncbi:hypothetical protein EK904_012624, partial [Melospiza melodia maxima]
RAAGVYHREARSGKYRLTFAEAKAVCEYEGGHLATLQQLEAARKIGFHVCAAGWMAKGRVGYPIVKAGANCGFGKTGIVDYGIRLNRSERWDAYCYNPNGNVMTLKFLTDGSVTAGGFQIRYSALDTPAPAKNASAQGKNTFQAGKFGI